VLDIIMYYNSINISKHINHLLSQLLISFSHVSLLYELSPYDQYLLLSLLFCLLN